MKDNKKKNKTCFILHSISAILFFISGILKLITDSKFSIAYFGLSICFVCIAYIYYKSYKKGK